MILLSLASLSIGGWLTLAGGNDAAPDLCLEWRRDPGLPLRGAGHESVEFEVRIRNLGRGGAFAVILAAAAGDRSLGQPSRIEPGPAAGAYIDRSVRLRLPPDLDQLCLTARLQTLQIDDPRDPRQADNRICRRIDSIPVPSAAIRRPPPQR